MFSDRAWVAGNRAALRVAPFYLIATTAVGVALVGATMSGHRAFAIFLGLAEPAAFIGPAIAAAVLAEKASRAISG